MHILIVGSSGSGKTNFSKRIAADAEKRGEAVIVYDPVGGVDWPASATKYKTPQAFLNAIMQSKSAHVFIDEAKTLWNFDTKRADALLYRMRHMGLLFYVMGQRAEGMIPPNARNQCSKVIAFKQSYKDAETLGLEYGEGLRACTKLSAGEFIYSDGFSSGRGRLDYSAGFPPQIVYENGEQENES